jgi:hypothetical protein
MPKDLHDETTCMFSLVSSLVSLLYTLYPKINVFSLLRSQMILTLTKYIYKKSIIFVVHNKYY